MLRNTKYIALSSIGLMLSCFQGQAHESQSHYHANTEVADAQTTTSSTVESKNDHIDMNKLSEAFGNFIGRNLQSPGLKFDMESLIKGIRSGAAGEPSPLSEKEYEEMMVAVQEKAFKDMSTNNLKSANDFMTKNKSAPGVVEIVPEKLQYTIVTEGHGAAVEPHFSPKINYSGKYQDGTVFGTSEEMGGPITIPLDQTIPGFSKGIVGMKEGEKRKLFVHPDLGYGTSGQLPPNELLIFEIELVKANAEDEKSKNSSKAESNEHEDTDLDEDVEDSDKETK